MELRELAQKAEEASPEPPKEPIPSEPDGGSGVALRPIRWPQKFWFRDLQKFWFRDLQRRPPVLIVVRIVSMFQAQFL